MSRIKLNAIILQVFLIWLEFSFYLETVEQDEFDISQFLIEPSEYTEADEGTNAGNSSTPSNNVSGAKNASSAKRRPEWKPYIPDEIPESKIETLVKMETVLSEKALHNWDYCDMSYRDILKLCTKIWATLKVNMKILHENPSAEPVCDSFMKRAVPGICSKTGGHPYTGHYHYIDGENRNYFMNSLRCNCKYKNKGFRRAIFRSRTYFLLHQILPNQYLILSPINPDLTSQKDRSNIRLVDVFEDST